MILGEHKEFVYAINDACTCGGDGPRTGCLVCKVYHALYYLEMFTAEEKSGACESAWQDGWAAGRESPVRIENPYSKRKDG